ncbi:fluoride efflux transporter FluC [Bifidobacterium choloepi]|uniref:Fluoride-specific ion channel FluC n=1 Tax=Bifidobacterium choloepi TaxID=2614131 RepID=A0A6I5N9G0_9BIFI|nr:CrcB family protein [Bifidobacterium choloepi]NEG69130.1 CrcB family protein [Bifidobacterium choloepi]
MWLNILAVAGGAFCGGILHDISSNHFNPKRQTGWRMPYGTLLVNLAGSFVLGLMLGWMQAGAVPVGVKGLLVTGFCGGLTTFSTFAGDAFSSLQTQPAVAILIMLGNLLFGMLAFVVAVKIVLGREFGRLYIGE